MERLGSNQVRTVDVRVIAATSRDLKRMVEEGSFRADLYYRLNVLPITIPPLRERREDLPLLVDTLLDAIRDASGAAPAGIEPEALALLAEHPWPGNVRELRNVLEQAAAIAEPGETLSAAHLAGALSSHRPQPGLVVSEAPLAEVRPLREAMADAERAAIQRALTAAGGGKSQAAKLLGISRAQFYEKLSSLGLA